MDAPAAFEQLFRLPTSRSGVSLFRPAFCAGAGQTSGHNQGICPVVPERPDSGLSCRVVCCEAKAGVVVAVARVVVVAIGRAAVPRVVVPAAAAQHPVGATSRCLTENDLKKVAKVLTSDVQRFN